MRSLVIIRVLRHERQNLNRTATYPDERQVGHGELCLVISLEKAWHLHAEVLLWYILRRWERRELGVVGA